LSSTLRSAGVQLDAGRPRLTPRRGAAAGVCWSTTANTGRQVGAPLGKTARNCSTTEVRVAAGGQRDSGVGRKSPLDAVSGGGYRFFSASWETGAGAGGVVGREQGPRRRGKLYPHEGRSSVQALSCGKKELVRVRDLHLVAGRSRPHRPEKKYGGARSASRGPRERTEGSGGILNPRGTFRPIRDFQSRSLGTGSDTLQGGGAPRVLPGAAAA